MGEPDAHQDTPVAPKGDRAILSEMVAQQYTLAAFYSRLRAQVEHENSLYDRRMMWLVTLQAILFATMGFVIGGFLSEDIFGLEAKLPQMAIITPVMVFVTLICIAGMLTALACHRALGQAAAVNKEIGELWEDRKQKIFEFEQSQLRAPRMTYEDARAMFPHPRGGWKANDADDAMDRHAPVLRTRYIPLLFVVIWGITLLMVLGGLEWILIADPIPADTGRPG